MTYCESLCSKNLRKEKNLFNFTWVWNQAWREFSNFIHYVWFIKEKENAFLVILHHILHIWLTNKYISKWIKYFKLAVANREENYGYNLVLVYYYYLYNSCYSARKNLDLFFFCSFWRFFSWRSNQLLHFNLFHWYFFRNFKKLQLEWVIIVISF